MMTHGFLDLAEDIFEATSTPSDSLVEDNNSSTHTATGAGSDSSTRLKDGSVVIAIKSQWV